MSSQPPHACTGEAVFSACGRYRYRLERRWSAGGGNLVWIMLNPSRADAGTDDPTIRRCIAFSRLWGYSGMLVVNLFALCATHPDTLYGVSDPVGPENDAYIAAAFRSTAGSASAGPDIVAAWGAHPLAAGRTALVLAAAGGNVRCLGATRDGHPRHPLYVATGQPRMHLVPRASAARPAGGVS
ncbi:DUF1643 domain-containing protein [Rhizobium sp. TRM96647]|uniref:DUF1643 domain-containing protein n=1 Tax=unclassified Rhizobium TaxID=2613769 RepID=UPI0021E7AD0D|nr:MULTISPECIES: DUF1643 domain-containing protein [unclassified Rhizobium]MCV3736664.1 DUF1643 domain-containing protein [Rhizobium sp. TRM96647]MCV3756936.1 DUF1643 domain-containing protein [Rhizobium sp. TRM96650]